MLFPQKINVVASARHANPHNETVVVQNDTAVEFYVAVVGDNGQTELPEGATYTLVCLHLRKQPTEKLGTLQADGNVMFKLTHMELSETGPVQGQVRVYHPVGGRLTSNPFIFHVAPDPTYGAEIKPEDQSIIEQVIGEGPAIIAEAKMETELNITERARLTGAVGDALDSLDQDKADALLEMSQSKTAADESAQIAQEAADNADSERARLTQEVSDKITEVENARTATVEATGEALDAANLATQEADAARLQKQEVQDILGAGPVASVNGKTGVVDGLATQESVDQVTAQLAEKAQQSELEATGKRIDELIIESGDANAEVTDSHVSTTKNKTFGTLGNRLEEIEKETVIPIKNELVNSDFSEGYVGWSAAVSQMDLTGGIMKSTGSGGGSIPSLSQRTSYVAGDVYFAKVKARVLNTANNLKFRLAAGNAEVKIDLPEPNVWYDLAKRFTTAASSEAYINSVVHEYSSPEEANGKVLEVDNALIINLTKVFGRGSEPSEESMLKFLRQFEGSHFNGTANLGGKNAFEYLQERMSQIDVPDIDMSHLATTEYVNQKFDAVDNKNSIQTRPEDLQAQILYNSDSKLLTDFQTDVTATMGTIEYDTSEKFSGQRSLKMTTHPTNNYSLVRFDLGVGGTDMTDHYISLMGFRDSSGGSISKITISFKDESATTLSSWERASGGPLLHLRDEWQLITFTNGGETPLAGNVRYIDIMVTGRSAEAPAIVRFNQLRKIKSPETGYVTFTLDGGYLENFAELKSSFDEKDYRACLMLGRYMELDNSPSYLSNEQIKDLASSGWDISNHSGIRVDQATAKELEELAEFKQGWLNDRGFNNKRGGRFLCALTNAWNETAVRTLRKYYYFLRTGAGPVMQNAQQNTSLPIFNPINIPDVASNITYAEQELFIRRAAQHKQWVVLTWHQPDRPGELTLQEMRDMINLVDSLGLKVVTFSDVYDKVLRLPNN